MQWSDALQLEGWRPERHAPLRWFSFGGQVGLERLLWSGGVIAQFVATPNANSSAMAIVQMHAMDLRTGTAQVSIFEFGELSRGHVSDALDSAFHAMRRTFPVRKLSCRIVALDDDSKSLIEKYSFLDCEGVLKRHVYYGDRRFDAVLMGRVLV